MEFETSRACIMTKGPLAARFTQASVWISGNWERMLFSVFGLIGLGFCLDFLLNNQVTEAGIVFALSFFSFFYSNLARFRRFKGLGFEAELWEDKQKEASDLIERLKDVVSIYTREIVISNVTRNRLSDGASWEEWWALFEELVDQHSVLGQTIDFSDLKKKMDSYFLFDLCMPIHGHFSRSINKHIGEANKLIGREFGSPIKDVAGYTSRIEEMRKIKSTVDNPFKLSEDGKLATAIENMVLESRENLSRLFGISMDLDEQKMSRLRRLSELYNHRPVEVTDELLAWSREREKYS